MGSSTTASLWGDITPETWALSDGAVRPWPSEARRRGILAMWLAAGPLLGYVGYDYVMTSRGVTISQFWALTALLVLIASMTWTEERGLRGRELLTAEATGILGFAIGGLLTGAAPLRVVGMCLANVAAALAFVLLYRVRGGGRGWVPRTPAEAVWAFTSAGLVSGAAVIIGAYPGLSAGLPPDWFTFTWIDARQLTLLSITVHSLGVLTWRDEPDLLSQRGAGALLLFVIVSIPCIVVPFFAPDASLMWLLIGPAVLAGFLFAERQAVLASLGGVFFTMPMPYPTVPFGAGRPPLAPEAIVDMTSGLAMHVTLMLVLFRQDVAARRHELADQRERYRAEQSLLDGILQNIGGGVVLADGIGRVCLANDVASRQLGAPLPDMLSPEWAATLDVHMDAVPPDQIGLRTLLEGSREQTSVTVRIGGGEDARELLLTTRAVHLGGATLSLMMGRDVTDERARQRELQSFAGTVAHDLKGPLAALVGWMEAASDEVLDGDLEAGRAALARAETASERMRALVDDYLAYAVSRNGELILADVVLTEVVTEIAEVYSAGPQSARFEIDTPHVLRADAALTKQLLANIVGNAVKYSRENEPPWVSVRSLDGLPGWAEVFVADHGRGLEPGDEERIFAAFSRSEKDASSVQGIGLGLALCHAIVTRHGGTIRAENNEWGGATFRFTMPVPGDDS